VDINLRTNSELLTSIKTEGDILEGKELKPWDRLLSVFKDGAEDGRLHIIVQRPASTCNCVLRCWYPVDCFLPIQAKLTLLLSR